MLTEAERLVEHLRNVHSSSHGSAIALARQMAKAVVDENAALRAKLDQIGSITVDCMAGHCQQVQRALSRLTAEDKPQHVWRLQGFGYILDDVCPACTPEQAAEGGTQQPAEGKD